MDSVGNRRKKNSISEEPLEKRNKQKNGLDHLDAGPSTSVADRLVEMWRTGPNFPPVFTQESSDDVKLKKLEAQCFSLTEINCALNARLATSEEQIGKMTAELKNEALMQERLIQKMDSVWSYMKDITDTVNYVTTTLDEYKALSEQLSSQYNDISRVYSDNQVLKTQAEQSSQTIRKQAAKLNEFAQNKSELSELKPKHQILLVEVESYKRKLQELEEDQRRMQREIVQLEVAASEAKRQFALTSASEADKSTQQRQAHEAEMQRVLRETEGLKANAARLQEERDDVFRLLAEKEEEIQEIKKSVEAYKSSITAIQSELNEKTSSCARADEAKAKCESEMQEKSRQICELSQELEGLKLNLSRKTQEVVTLEEINRTLEQDILKKDLQAQEDNRKFGEAEIEQRRRLEILQENFTQRTSELQELEGKWRQADAERETIQAQLVQTTLELQTVQKENGEINHKLALMSSTKEYEVGDLKYHLEVLTKEMAEKQAQFDAENQELKRNYAEIEKRCADESTARKENCENFRREAAGFDAQIQQLLKLNEVNLEEANRVKAQFSSCEQMLKEVTRSEEQLRERLKGADAELAAAGRMIENLGEQSGQLEGKNRELLQLQADLKLSEEKTKDLQGKFYDTTANLNEKIRQLQEELDSARMTAQDKRSFLRSESFLKHQKNLEVSQTRAREFEEKYYAIHAEQEAERIRNHNLQRQVEEHQRKERVFEEQQRTFELQAMEITRKISTIDRSLQEKRIVSPSAWKKSSSDVSLSQKRVAIRSDVMLPPGTIAPMLPPKTPKIPRQPPKSILKSPSPATPPGVGHLMSPRMSPRMSPMVSPRASPLMSPRTPKTPAKGPEPKEVEEPPRSSSPDSSAMVVDEFDLNGKDIFGDPTIIRPKKSPASQPKGGKKFFKSRGSHLK